MRTVKIPLSNPPMQMLEDFRDMVNCLIDFTIQRRIYSAFKLRDRNRTWFRKNYDQYPAHYLHSASSQAMGMVKSWRKKRGKRPRLTALVARLDQELFRMHGSILHITIKPRKEYLEVDLTKCGHKKLTEYITARMGEITIGESFISIPFQYEIEKTPSKQKAGIDINFKSVDIAHTDGGIDSIDTSELASIKRRMSEKRKGIQKKVTHPRRRKKLEEKYRKREHNRINDRLHKLANEISEKCKDEEIAFENLKHIRRRTWNKSFNRRLHNWNFSQLQNYVEYRHSHPIAYVDPAYTSSIALCHSDVPVEHPRWDLSTCTKCGCTYSRDKMAAAVILSRAMGTTPLAPNATALLCQGSLVAETENPWKEAVNVC